MRYGMVINLKRCVGCDACTVACKQANGTPPTVFYTHVEHEEKGVYPDCKTDHTPMLCMHCEKALCVEVCPTGASEKQKDGTVTIDNDKCIGCLTCMDACPYGARSAITQEVKGYFKGKGLSAQEKAYYGNFQQEKVYKCDFCAERRGKGEQPACTATCPADARVFGDLDDKKSPVSKLIKENKTFRMKQDLGSTPQVYYIEK